MSAAAACTGTTGGSTDCSDRNLLGAIVDGDTGTGLLLTGIANVDARSKRNYYIFNALTTPPSETEVANVRTAFTELTTRKDIAILIISRPIADLIRTEITRWQGASVLPTIVEIPSKEQIS